MQGLADGYFVIPYTVGIFLSNEIRTPRFNPDSLNLKPRKKPLTTASKD